MNKEVYMNNDYILIDGELYHYGVPGMKWGHRKSTSGVENSYSRRIAKKAKKLNEAELNSKRKVSNALSIGEVAKDFIIDRPIRDIVRATGRKRVQKQLNRAINKAKSKGYDVEVKRSNDIKNGKTLVDAIIKDKSGNTYSTNYEGTFNPNLKRKKKK